MSLLLSFLKFNLPSKNGALTLFTMSPPALTWGRLLNMSSTHKFLLTTVEASFPYLLTFSAAVFLNAKFQLDGEDIPPNTCASIHGLQLHFGDHSSSTK